MKMMFQEFDSEDSAKNNYFHKHGIFFGIRRGPNIPENSQKLMLISVNPLRTRRHHLTEGLLNSYCQYWSLCGASYLENTEEIRKTGTVAR